MYSSSSTSEPISEEKCPYFSSIDSSILCYLWEQINNSLESGTTPFFESTILYSVCPYPTLSDGILACELWCQLLEHASGSTCISGPICPYENYTKPHNDNLCQLWAENLNLENTLFGSTTPLVINEITPIYTTNSLEESTVICVYKESSYNEEYCSLWCENQLYKYGQECSEPKTTTSCPYDTYTTSIVLCFLWNQISEEKQSGSTLPETTFTVPYTSCPHIGLVEGILACELWCQLQVFTTWTICTDTPICPYENYSSPHNNDLCTLWAENVNLENNIFGNTIPNSSEGITPLHSTDPSASNNITCIYDLLEEQSLYPEYCEIWCETQFYKYGQICREKTTVLTSTTIAQCPYANYADNITLCLLWESILNASVSSTISNFITNSNGNLETDDNGNFVTADASGN